MVFVQNETGESFAPVPPGCCKRKRREKPCIVALIEEMAEGNFQDLVYFLIGFEGPGPLDIGDEGEDGPLKQGEGIGRQRAEEIDIAGVEPDFFPRLADGIGQKEVDDAIGVLRSSAGIFPGGASKNRDKMEHDHPSQDLVDAGGDKAAGATDIPPLGNTIRPFDELEYEPWRCHYRWTIRMDADHGSARSTPAAPCFIPASRRLRNGLPLFGKVQRILPQLSADVRQ